MKKKGKKNSTAGEGDLFIFKPTPRPLLNLPLPPPFEPVICLGAPNRNGPTPPVLKSSSSSSSSWSSTVWVAITCANLSAAALAATFWDRLMPEMFPPVGGIGDRGFASDDKSVVPLLDSVLLCRPYTGGLLGLRRSISSKQEIRVRIQLVILVSYYILGLEKMSWRSVYDRRICIRGIWRCSF